MPTIKNYLSLVKFSHTLFAMPFALIGFFTAIVKPGNAGSPDSLQFLLTGGINPYVAYTKYLLLVIGCMVFARSAAMAFNRYLDAAYDARNPRTAVREIPAGILRADHVLFFTGINCILFITCCFFINKTCFYLSPVALFVIMFYSYTKRFTAWCHLVLGLGLSLAPIGAHLAVTGSFSLLPVIFSAAVLFWVSGFDIIYALQDREFDKAENLHSIPSATGNRTALRISELFHLLSAACVALAGVYGHFGALYWAGVALFLCLLVYQHLIVKPGDLSRVNRAFFTTNGLASLAFAIFVIGDLFAGK
jgi:4-hydroxybenzoate polyprenyltransferase